MIHVHSLDDNHLQNAWLTIGIFDGVHRGHLALLGRLVSGAHAGGLPAVVLTFTPHPAVVLGGRMDFKCLTTPDERAGLLAELGVDAVVTHPFDLTLAAQSAEEFMRRAAGALTLRRLLIGYDFALGRGREGDASRLAELGRLLGYEVEVFEPVREGVEIISSTAIRAWVAAGQVAEAAILLGHPYSLSGAVIHGDGRGRSLRIPTANLEVPPEKLIPANGVYACRAWVGGEGQRAVANIGVRPTFTPDEYAPHVEAHLLDFEGDLYGQEIKLEFARRLRDEMKFPSGDALVEQIHADIRAAREALG